MSACKISSLSDYPAELERHIDFQNGGDGVTGFGCDDATHLKRLKSICKPNFKERSESTGEMLLPVCKNERPPY